MLERVSVPRCQSQLAAVCCLKNIGIALDRLLVDEKCSGDLKKTVSDGAKVPCCRETSHFFAALVVLQRDSVRAECVRKAPEAPCLGRQSSALGSEGLP